MNRKLLAILGILFLIALFVGEYFFVENYVCEQGEESAAETEAPKAMMVLIEFQDTEGLVNMVNDMKQRDIYGLLMVTPDFVEENLEDVQKVVAAGNVEIVPSYVQAPLWDISYEDQHEIISDMVDRIEAALDVDVRIISSRYMASDENTVKAAEDLGIEYVMARGTTDLAMTVYQPEEYNVKILSVSNIDTVEYKYGSLCDYSYYERGGSPDDMLRDLERAAQEDKFFGVSHTYIGGQKARWNDMWHSFWDNNDIDWTDLDGISEADKNMPMWQIPVNKNAPYTPEKIRPAIPYDEEEDVNNPCSVEEL
ncbi:hypothetical protein JW978_03455 [Candidatus Dojkabacteria bacterium]|nr:hypothetical protein [Candidatus Dojkabacteria bacterium]